VGVGCVRQACIRHKGGLRRITWVPGEAARLFGVWMRSSGALFVFSYRQAGRVKDCNAWRAVRDVAGDTGYHLPIVGSAFRLPDQGKSGHSWLLRVPLR